jgi:phosphate transport system substrate-binding protein
VIIIGYSDSVQPLMDLAFPVFSAQAAAPELVVELGNAVTVWDGLVSGRLDGVVLLDRPDGQRCGSNTGAEDGYWSTVVALDGLAMVVHSDNRVNGLALTETRSLFRGQTTSWRSLGGTDMVVEVVTRETGSDAGRLFDQLVMREHRTTLTAVVVPGSEAAIEYVRLHPAAIGYVGAAFTDAGVRTVAVEGVLPSPATIGDGTYPLTGPVCFVSRMEPEGGLRQVVSWLLNREGQSVIGQRYGRVR